MTRRMAKLLGMTSLLTAGLAEPAWPQTPPRPGVVRPSIVSIPRGELSRALRRFSQQTGRDVSFPPQLVRKKTAGPVDGRLHPDIALTRLLSGTGLSFRAIGKGYVLVAAPAPVRPVVRADAAPPPSVDADIVVIGTRLGGGEAADIKRRALQSVSVLTQDDIAALPDTSLADVVRRIPGLQLSVRAGGGIVTIRGLSQTEDRINGRNLSNTVVRGFDIAALPSDIVSGIDVYKTPSASQIEGGIGGVIDFHTRRPFDVDGGEIAVTAKGVLGDLDGRMRPYVSGHAGGRIDTPVGEMGLLVGGSHQAQDIAQDLVRIDSIAPQVTATGDTIDAPVNATKRYLRGTKALTAGYAAAQWRPSGSLELAGDLLYNRSVLDFTNTSLQVALADATASGPFAPDARGDTIRAGRWTDAPVTSSTSHGTGTFHTLQWGVSARYRHGPVTLLADVSQTGTRFDYGAPTLTLRSVAPEVAYDAAGGLPRFVLAGVDPARSAAWRFATLGDFAVRDTNGEHAYRLDGTYALNGPIQSVKAGVRIARRSVVHGLGFRTGAAPDDAGTVEGSGFVGLTDGDLFGAAYPQSRWIAPRPAILSAGRVGAVRAAFGIDPAMPDLDPALGYRAEETAGSGYAEATFSGTIGDIPVDGNAGLRYAATILSIAGPTASLTMKRRYAHWLPSINLRAEVGLRLYARLSYSRQISRPAFNLLAPTVSLDFVNGTGDAGNPALNALVADQFDAALEYYPAPGANLYAAAFYKQVGGFIRMVGAPETVNGQRFLINRPFNVDDGWIGGVEAGFKQRFTGLPGALAGLGLQANYTFIDSFEADNGAGVRVPLEQMSRHNYMLAATYDRDGISATLTWTWRSRIAEVSRGDSFGRPLFRDPYGQLDGSATVPLSPRVSVTMGAINLLQRRSTEYFGTSRLLNQSFIESRRMMIGLTIRSKPT
ncbi:TonB-dependent receptor [Sphingomonas sp. 2R-10]|uniref:TonB-dependent receptor n=1 Tax=Sphingomonas sp. 2R-10 TaxID=3045148 RepID=UPI0013DE1EDE|nr:TonB-dependent receptor [Sphingomonas sp. 2R-10]MDJ0276431.1 TonB-dependent receptor [Sphingomonas sp. 2R-10]